MKLYLIRHGNTIANEQRLYYGSTDIPLSPTGVSTILALKDEGIYPDVTTFYTTGLKRTNQTLSLIYGDVPYQIITDLAEYHFGEFEMKSYADLVNLPAYQNWIEDTLDTVLCPGGESKKMFKNRVIHAFETLVYKQANASAACCICHGGVIATLMEHYVPDQQNFYEWQPAPGHGYCLEFIDSRFNIYSRL